MRPAQDLQYTTPLSGSIARPAPAEHALPELRERVGSAAEVPGELREAAGIFSGQFPLLAHHSNLFPEFAERVAGSFILTILTGPGNFLDCFLHRFLFPDGSFRSFFSHGPGYTRRFFFQ